MTMGRQARRSWPSQIWRNEAFQEVDMKRPFIGILVLAALALVTTLAVGGVALAQTPTPPAGSDGAKTPWIGVSLVDLSERVAARLGISQTTGVAVVTVTADSPAAKAGIKAKDVITAVDGKSVTKASEVSAAVKSKKAGDSIAITVVRAWQDREPQRGGRRDGASPRAGPAAARTPTLSGQRPSRRLAGCSMG